jgi:hypothetical protein
MPVSCLVVGSLRALEVRCSDAELFSSWRDVDVVIVPTAAAFTSLEAAAVACATPFSSRDARVESLMLKDRSTVDDAYFVRRLREADVVVLSDGSSLHARSVWRSSPVGEAIGAARCLVAVGATASVLGTTMIDPRGGAPTTGLGYRDGLVITTTTPLEQLARTRSLLDDDVVLAVVGEDGALDYDGVTWRASGDVVATRGPRVVTLD